MITLEEGIKITTEERDGNLLVIPEGPLTIYEVGALHQAFASGFKDRRGLLLDLNGVTECDTAGVQLLCSARKTAEEKDASFEVIGIAHAVLKALNACGLVPEKVFDLKEEV
ncbi:MAG: STAS domain-containing protein [Thermodesulfobacteriota bacterium]